MKINFEENQHGTGFTLEPETPQEFAQLARFTKSSKKEKPDVFLSFSNSPYCQVWFKKVDPTKQINSINNH